MSEDYIKALKDHDRTILEKAGRAPTDLPKEIDKVISTLDDEARELAVELVARQDSKYAGTFLLRRMNDSSPDVAMLAIESMESVINKPSIDDVISMIAKVKDPFIRGKLYLDIGTKKEEGLIGKLRSVVENEEDEEAELRGLAALVRLDGKGEAQRFIGIIGETEPDDVLEMQDLILYVGKQSVAGGLIPWLSNDAEIMRLGGDRQDSMARMNDIGVWIVHLLKIELPFETTHLRNFTDEEIDETKKKLKIVGN